MYFYSKNFSFSSKCVEKIAQKLYNFYIKIIDLYNFTGVNNMAKVKDTKAERTVISVSLSKNDKLKLKELAAKKEVTASALISQWIKEQYETEATK